MDEEPEQIKYMCAGQCEKKCVSLCSKTFHMVYLGVSYQFVLSVITVHI